jgi:nucleoid-associated protein YgaU
MTAHYEGRHTTRTPDGGTASKRYTVKPGDTLVDIASRFGLEGGWKALYEKNLWVLGGNPNDLLPGQRLAL